VRGTERARERRSRVYREAPGFRPAPRMESRAFARGCGVLSTVCSPLDKVSTLSRRAPLAPRSWWDAEVRASFVGVVPGTAVGAWAGAGVVPDVGGAVTVLASACTGDAAPTWDCYSCCLWCRSSLPV